MNIQLINSLVQLIQSLSEEKLLLNNSDVTIHQLVEVILNSCSFDFLDNEPDIYTFEDGEPVQCHSKKV